MEFYKSGGFLWLSLTEGTEGLRENLTEVHLPSLFRIGILSRIPFLPFSLPHPLLPYHTGLQSAPSLGPAKAFLLGPLGAGALKLLRPHLESVCICPYALALNDPVSPPALCPQGIGRSGEGGENYHGVCRPWGDLRLATSQDSRYRSAFFFWQEAVECG